MNYIEQLGEATKKAKKSIATASTAKKNEILEKIAQNLRKNIDVILSENEKDTAMAKENGITDAMVDRLRLTPERINDIADACIYLTGLNDPVGEVIEGYTRPNGMRITKTRVPMGVIGIIFESRPNVTVDAATLCIKSGNAAILRGGKEAINSNKILMDIMRTSVEECGIQKDIIQLVEDTSRESSNQMMKANGYIDIDMAVSVTNNGKTQRPSVCNALETCLVHKSAAKEFLPKLMDEFKKFDVDVRGCDRTRGILGDGIKKATELDYATEFDDYIMAVKVVDDIDEAIEHISKYSTGHSECIITNNLKNAEKFQREIDSACVYVNCSTRFTDGGEFGFGAEIGISTQRLHARGPMGLRELTTMKYLINGDGQIRK